MSQLVFVCIYATVGVGLMILTGFTGQASLGHAAFLAIGAYTAGYLQQLGVPFPVYFLAAGILIIWRERQLGLERTRQRRPDLYEAYLAGKKDGETNP